MIETLLLLVGVMWVFSKKEESDMATDQNPTASTGKYTPSQPSQKYPWQPIIAPRTDNSNQPWYGGDRSSMMGPVSVLSENPMKGDHVATLWETLNGFFGDSPKQNLIAQASVVPSPQNTGTDSGVTVENITSAGDY